MAEESSTNQPRSGTQQAKQMLVETNKMVEAQLVAAREDAANRLAAAERLAYQMVEEAKGRATEEAVKIIAAAKAEAEAESIKAGMDYGGTRVQRMIEFPPGLKQAGISILSYFSEVLRQRYRASQPAAEGPVLSEGLGLTR